MSNPKQLDLLTDWPRSRQLDALRRVVIPMFRGKGFSVSPAILKATLKAIDDHEGRSACFASQETLAREIGCSRKTIERAVCGLVSMDLITRERNGIGTNRHRVVWTSVSLLVDAVDHIPSSETKGASSVGDDSTDIVNQPLRHTAGFGSPQSAIETDMKGEALRHGDGQTDKLNENLTAPLTDDWAAVQKEMFDWSLRSSAQGCQSAKARGWSIEYVKELFELAGRQREPERWEPGQLANWLTGRVPPPITTEQAAERQSQRSSVNHAKAKSIRQSVTQAGRDKQAPDWIIAGTVYRRLRDAQLDQLATETERASADRMDELDAQRSQSVGDIPPTMAPPPPRIKQAPSRSYVTNQRRQSIIDQLVLITDRN